MSRIYLRIVVYDEDPGVRKLLQRGLTGYGYEVLVTNSPEDALDTALSRSPNIILLGISSETSQQTLELCHDLRDMSSSSIIILAEVDDKQAKLAALNAGADDYLLKPFDMDELEARIRAVVRRSSFRNPNSLTGEIRIYDLNIDLIRRRVMLLNSEVHLTPREYDLLTFLATNPGRVIPFEILLEKAWGSVNSANPEQYVRVYMNSLRRKLGDNPTTTDEPRFIFNEYGIGYRFADL